jgi:hypothetical protein
VRRVTRPPLPVLSWLLALLAPPAITACNGDPIVAVGGPGGAFASGAGCNVADLAVGGHEACPSQAQIGFDAPGDGAAVTSTPNLSGKAVSCRRSYCGPGSLVLHAAYRWPPSGPVEGEKLGDIRHSFAQPVEMYGKTITHALYLDGPTTPVNAYVAVIDRNGRFWMVQDLPVYLFRQWTQRGATVDADNARLALPAGTTSLQVREIRIAVYLARDVLTGDREHWNADVYIDELGWR